MDDVGVIVQLTPHPTYTPSLNLPSPTYANYYILNSLTCLLDIDILIIIIQIIGYD